MNKLFTTIGACLLLASFTACTHKSNVLPTVTNPSITTNTPSTVGSWKVSEYTEQGTDATPDFSGYTFMFGSTGPFMAMNSSLSVTGTWTRGADDGEQKLTLTISSATDAHLAELNEDWTITIMSDTNINLVDDSGHHQLNFVKVQ